MKYVKQWMAVCVSVLLLWTTVPQDAEGFGVPPAGGAAQEVYAPVPPNDMDALVAPIALYPDALVAQILGAATYPDQVEAADTFVKSNYNLSGDALVQAAENQEWDPSVMALLQFPSVLDKLAQEPGMDIGAGGCVGEPARRRDGGHPADAREGVRGGKSEVGRADQSGEGESGHYSDSTGESAGGVCAGVQPDGDLWCAGSYTGIQLGRCRSDGDDHFWVGHRRGRDGE